MDEMTRALAAELIARRRLIVAAKGEHARRISPKALAESRAKAEYAAACRAKALERIAQGAPSGYWGQTAHDRMLLAFEGGEWFANSDLGKRLGVTVQIAQWETRYGRKKGWLDRVENAEYAGKPQPSSKQKEQPKFLWRVNDQGRRQAALIRANEGLPKPSMRTIRGLSPLKRKPR